MKYESFSCEFDRNEGLEVDISVEYESFSFDPIITDILFESRKFEFIKFETIATKDFDLD